jgi:hypothetical protein
VSAVRARESRLARRRCELRSRVPHEDAVSVASKLAQWVEQRSHTPSVMGSNPMLALASQAGSRKSAGLRPRIEVPRRRRRSSASPARVGRTRSDDRSARSALSGKGTRRWKCAAMRLNQSPDAGEGRLLTRRAEGAATLTARGTGVGHTSTYFRRFQRET